MIRISDKEKLLEAFRPIDREHVEFDDQLTFPLGIRDYFKWVTSAGKRAFLVFADPGTGRAMGVMFERHHSGFDAPPSMCHWCHTVRINGGVSLLTAASTPNLRVGVHICADLSCRENVMGPPGVNDFRPNNTGVERVQRILLRMANFARRNLFQISLIHD